MTEEGEDEAKGEEEKEEEVESLVEDYVNSTPLSLCSLRKATYKERKLPRWEVYLRT